MSCGKGSSKQQEERSIGEEEHGAQQSIVKSKAGGVGCIAKRPRNEERSLAGKSGREPELLVNLRRHTKAVLEVMAGTDSRFELSGLMLGEEWRLKG